MRCHLAHIDLLAVARQRSPVALPLAQRVVNDQDSIVRLCLMSHDSELAEIAGDSVRRARLCGAAGARLHLLEHHLHDSRDRCPYGSGTGFAKGQHVLHFHSQDGDDFVARQGHAQASPQV